MSFKERTDVTAVPAMGVVAETMMALVLASEALRKFGGDSLAEVVRNRDGYMASLGETPSVPPPALMVGGDAAHAPAAPALAVGMMGSGKTTVGRLVAAAPRLAATSTRTPRSRRRPGTSVPEIFAESGEAAFRAERDQGARTGPRRSSRSWSRWPVGRCSTQPTAP